MPDLRYGSQFMRILLTGGTGFIGTALRRAIKAEGHDVRLLVRHRHVEDDAVEPLDLVRVEPLLHG